MYEILVVHFIVFFAAVLQAVTGFGFAVMATPLMLLFLNSADCIQISIFLSLFMSIMMLPAVWKAIDWAIFKRLMVGSIIGAPAGLALYMSLPLNTIKLIVAIVLLLVVVCSFMQKEKANIQGRQKSIAEFVVGIFSGILTASIGMPGVPLALYFAQSDTNKEQIRSTALVFYVGIYIVSIVFQGVAGQIESHSIMTFLVLAPITVLGTFLGNRMFARVNQKVFVLLIHSIMFYTGLYMLWNISS